MRGLSALGTTGSLSPCLPLLVETPDGLRCSANTAKVRPFWGTAARYYGGTFLGVYAAAVLGVFIFLRTIGYPVSIVHVGLPPLWYKVGQARGWYFLEQSQRAFAAGQSAEGLLYLANSYEFDPTNYEAGIALAKNYQANQPTHADEVFAKLLREHPAKREATAEAWFRALLPRGDFKKCPLGPGRDPDELRLFQHLGAGAFLATRRTNDDRPLRDLLASRARAAVVWHPLIELERLRSARQTKEARAAIDRAWPATSSAFTLFLSGRCVDRNAGGHCGALFARAAPPGAQSRSGGHAPPRRLCDAQRPGAALSPDR
ncbi:MAG: tetratricopeptide repeat protein [Opitutus sp.]|nr:tetratricopeptide repeat protein [Opitutus sp.]